MKRYKGGTPLKTKVVYSELSDDWRLQVWVEGEEDPLFTLGYEDLAAGRRAQQRREKRTVYIDERTRQQFFRRLLRYVDRESPPCSRREFEFQQRLKGATERRKRLSLCG